MTATDITHHTGTLPTDKGSTRIAFFDLDGTLICGYSIFALARETISKSLSDGQWQDAAGLMQDLVRGPDRRTTGGSYHRLVRRLSRALKGNSESNLEAMGQRAYDHYLAQKIFSESIVLIEAHRRAGHHVVMVTSASRYQAEPIARELGIDEICCTQLVVKEGRFTGAVQTPMCFAEGKVLAARSMLRKYGGRMDDAWFYSDSCADLPLLKAVGHPVAVNPSDRLARRARLEGWPILNFRSRGSADVASLTRTSLTTQAITSTWLAGRVGSALGIGAQQRANSLTRLLGRLAGRSAGLTLQVEGKQHLAAHRPCIFVFNHQSLLDAVVLARLLEQDVVPFCKQEMADAPIVGPLLRQIDTIFVDRKNPDQSAVLQRALGVLNEGRSLAIAPEGTRSTLGTLQPFKQGAFYLAKKARVPIVPIVLHNVKDALPKGSLLIRPANIRVSVLEPVLPGELGGIRAACSHFETLYREELGRSVEAAIPHAREVSVA